MFKAKLIEENFHLTWTNEKGFGIIAARDMDVKELVLAEPPFTYVLNDSIVDKCCHNCYEMLNAENLLRCSQCKYTFYCSYECQKKHWRQFHKLECKFFSSLPSYLLQNSDIMLGFRFYLLVAYLIKSGSIKGEIRASRNSKQRAIPSIEELQRYNEHILPYKHTISAEDCLILPDQSDHPRNAEFKSNCTKLALMVGRFFGATPSTPALFYSDCSFVDEAARLLFRGQCCKFSCESVIASTGRFGGFGLGLCVRQNLFNNSCCANCKYGNGKVVTIAPVRKGEELTIFYGSYPELCLWERRKEFEGHLFICGCERCRQEESGLENVKSLEETLNSINAEARKLFPFELEMNTKPLNGKELSTSEDSSHIDPHPQMIFSPLHLLFHSSHPLQFEHVENSSKPSVSSFNPTNLSSHQIHATRLQLSLQNNPPSFLMAILCDMCGDAAFPILTTPTALHLPLYSSRNRAIFSDPPVTHFFCTSCHRAVLKTEKYLETNSSQQHPAPGHRLSTTHSTSFLTLQRHPIADALSKISFDVFKLSFNFSQPLFLKIEDKITPIQSFFQHLFSFYALCIHLKHKRTNPLSFPLCSFASMLPAARRTESDDVHYLSSRNNDIVNFLLYAVDVLKYGVKACDVDGGKLLKSTLSSSSSSSPGSFSTYLFPPCHPLNRTLLEAKSALLHHVSSWKSDDRANAFVIWFGKLLIGELSVVLPTPRFQHSTALCTLCIGDACRMLGRVEEGLVYGKEALEVYTILTGPNHLNTSGARRVVEDLERRKGGLEEVPG